MSCKYNNCKICGYKSECEIYKENAELKAQIENDRDLPVIAYQQGAESYKRKADKQLAKAKEYIKLLLMNCVGVYESTGKTIAEIQAEAEQFLNSEVEK